MTLAELVQLQRAAEQIRAFVHRRYTRENKARKRRSAKRRPEVRP